MVEEPIVLTAYKYTSNEKENLSSTPHYDLHQS